jgi:hypothetical protein
MFWAQRNRWRGDFWPPSWSVRRRHDTRMLLVLLLCGSLVIVMLTSTPFSSIGKGAGSSSLSGSPSVLTVNAPRVVLAPRATFASAPHMPLFSFGHTPPGLMQPTVDAQGNLWVGEMSANRLPDWMCQPAR